MDDNQIISLYHERKETAIKETEKKYGAYCHEIALRLLDREEDAKECVNDTYLAAWNAMPPQWPRWQEDQEDNRIVILSRRRRIPSGSAASSTKGIPRHCVPQNDIRKECNYGTG